MELPDIIVVILVILAITMAILSHNLKDVIGELFLFLIEIGILIGIIVIAIYGQTISRA